MYKFISLKDLRPRLPEIVKSIDKELERYVVSRRGEPIVIMMSLDDYESIIETLNEQCDIENLKRIRKAMKEAKSGKTIDWTVLKKKLKFQ